jgi:hypothetical protein
MSYKYTIFHPAQNLEEYRLAGTVLMEPQHTQAGLIPAIEVALTRDGYGAMALLSMRADGAPVTDDVIGRVRQIAAVDWEKAGWHPMDPQSDWRPGQDPDAVSGFDALTMATRVEGWSVVQLVQMARSWLETGSFSEMESALETVRRKRAEQRQLYLDVPLVAGGLVAVVRSPLEYAAQWRPTRRSSWSWSPRRTVLPFPCLARWRSTCETGHVAAGGPRGRNKSCSSSGL